MLWGRKKIFIGLSVLFLLGVLAGAAYWMTISWIKIKESSQYWTEESCKVLNITIEQTKSGYLPLILVNTSADDILNARISPNEGFSATKQEAKAEASAYQTDSQYSCYVNPSNTSQVVMKQSGIPAVDTAGAAVGTAVVVIILMVFGFGLCYLDKRRIAPNSSNWFMYNFDADRAMNRGIDHGNTAVNPYSRPDNPAFTLSKQQIEYVCDLCHFSPDLYVSQAVCAICLEELCSSENSTNFEDETDKKYSRKSLLKLNCGHVYHMICMQRWMMRGGIHCPLCHWNIWSLFGEVQSSSATQVANSTS
eukprot:jgi/Galph1/4002/GphlegSOOS_G2687.1